jgi:TatD family-associated radical SAM protein
MNKDNTIGYNRDSCAITYRFSTPVYPANILYVNIVDNYRCINDCAFCSRPRIADDFGKPNIYEKKAGTCLYLPNAPTIEEIMASIYRNIKDDDKELAIIGLGEPLIYLDLVVDILTKVKAKYNIKTRVDTNGLAKCLHTTPAERLSAAGLDEIRISLNETDAESYNKLCKPKFSDAYQKLIEFIQECRASSINTFVSFVVGFADETLGVRTKPKNEYIDFAQSIGVPTDHIIIREFVPPLNQ